MLEPHLTLEFHHSGQKHCVSGTQSHTPDALRVSISVSKMQNNKVQDNDLKQQQVKAQHACFIQGSLPVLHDCCVLLNIREMHGAELDPVLGCKLARLQCTALSEPALISSPLQLLRVGAESG